MILLCNLGTVRMKFELKVLRSCSDEAIEMPGQLDEVVALFGCLSEWEERGRDKKISKKKLQPQTKATARTSGRNSFMVIPWWIWLRCFLGLSLCALTGVHWQGSFLWGRSLTQELCPGQGRVDYELILVWALFWTGPRAFSWKHLIFFKCSVTQTEKNPSKICSVMI